VTEEQIRRILGHLQQWSKYAFDEFAPADLERAADEAEREGDYAAAARLRNRAFEKREAGESRGGANPPPA
jgi:hypothetical protein